MLPHWIPFESYVHYIFHLSLYVLFLCVHVHISYLDGHRTIRKETLCQEQWNVTHRRRIHSLGTHTARIYIFSLSLFLGIVIYFIYYILCCCCCNAFCPSSHSLSFSPPCTARQELAFARARSRSISHPPTQQTINQRARKSVVPVLEALYGRRIDRTPILHKYISCALPHPQPRLKRMLHAKMLQKSFGSRGLKSLLDF